MREFNCLRLGILSILLAAGFAAVRGQSQAVPPLETVLNGAGEQRKAYINEFKNLLSEETKISETYNKDGESKKRRAIVSTFVVYQPSADANAVGEYRNVVSVDNKKIDNADKRAQDFFEEIAKIQNSQKELERIEKEGSRFDDDISLNLFTLYQAVALADNLRPYFEFKIEGSEKAGDRNLLLVSYRQTRESPYVLTGKKNPPPDGKLAVAYDVDFDGDANGRLRGKMWIDSQNFQVWKEQREFTVQPEGFAAPVVFAETTFEYQPSSFGILTPRRIAYREYEVSKKTTVPRKTLGITFTYDKFTRPDVEVKSADVKN